jgi:hypothetical protein
MLEVLFVAIEINGVPRALAQELTAILFHMAQQVAPFHISILTPER